MYALVLVALVLVARGHHPPYGHPLQGRGLDRKGFAILEPRPTGTLFKEEGLCEAAAPALLSLFPACAIMMNSLFTLWRGVA